MSANPILPRMTPDEFLAYERGAADKHEFSDGQILAMAGGSPNHSLVQANLIGEVRSALKGRPCRVYSNDLKVRAGRADAFFYPDVTVVCGENEYHDSFKDVVVNPKAIFEVLSPATEAFDRGEKFEAYNRLDSLKTFVLASQEKRLVEVYSRLEGDDWKLSFFREGNVQLPDLEISLPIEEIYAQVDWATSNS